MSASILNLIRVIVVALIYVSPTLANSDQKIEVQFGCSVEHNNFLGMKDGRISGNNGLEILSDNKISIKLILNPISDLDAAWTFLLRLEGSEFERSELISISRNILEPDTALLKNQNLIVRDKFNTQNRLNLSEDFIHFVGEGQIIVMRRYYKSDWEGLAIVFPTKDTAIYQHTLAFNCRNKVDRISDILNEISIAYDK